MEGATIPRERGVSSKNRTINRKYKYSIMKGNSLARGSQAILLKPRIKKPRTSLSLIFLFMVLMFPISAVLVNESSNIFAGPIGIHQTSAEVPVLSLTYHSRLDATPKSVASGDRISGDHIILNATWTPAANANGARIVVNASAIPNTISANSTTNSVEIDTRSLGNNATCLINVTTWLTNGTAIYNLFTSIFIGNFFTPYVQVISPNGGETWPGSHNITWIAWDSNSDDSLTYEVLLSADDGKSFQLLAAFVEDTWLAWDFSSFETHSSYIIQVRAFDGIYTSFDVSDGNFTAGSIAPTTTNPTTTTPTAPAPDAVELRLPIFISAAILLSAVLSLIVYQQAKRLS